METFFDTMRSIWAFILMISAFVLIAFVFFAGH